MRGRAGPTPVVPAHTVCTNRKPNGANQMPHKIQEASGLAVPTYGHQAALHTPRARDSNAGRKRLQARASPQALAQPGVGGPAVSTTPAEEWISDKFHTPLQQPRNSFNVHAAVSS